MNNLDSARKILYGPGVNSTNRLPWLLWLLRGERDDQLFWAIFTEFWSDCDNTWNFRHNVVRRLRRRATRPQAPAQTWPLVVYRGCSSERIRNVAWTTERAVAARFAYGHRGIPVSDPVIAEAVVMPEAVFCAVNGRNEHEVLIDPAGLLDLKIQRVRP